MCRLILLMSAWLDGFAARRDGVIDWLTDPDEPSQGAERHRANLELLGQVGTIVLGRGAHDEMAQAWATSDNPMARLINALPKVVFSGSLTAADWSNTRVSSDPVEEAVPALKEQADEDLICFGGARIAQSLARHGLIDEYRLTVHPVVLGDGLPLLHGPQRLRPVSCTTYADGTVVHCLQAGVE